MCCFIAVLAMFGPRLAFLIYWLIPYGQLRVMATFNGWIMPLLGLIFLPWTTLMYVIVYGSNGIIGFDWIWLGFAILADISSYAGSVARRRDVGWYTGP